MFGFFLSWSCFIGGLSLFCVIQVNNAATADYGNSHEERKLVMQANYWGVKNVTRGLLPLLRPSSSGVRIINVSSHLGMLEVKFAYYIDSFCILAFQIYKHRILA